jgi:hypothetical protein
MSSEVLVEASITNVPFLNKAGLRREETVPFLVRSETLRLWETLERTSALVQGPPGSGKSTAVWFWLIRRVRRTDQTAVWWHFSRVGRRVYLRVSRKGDEINIEKFTTLEMFLTSSGEPDICVVDGVREDTLADAGRSWDVFPVAPDRHHMVWVSSQQVVLPGEELEQYEIEEVSYCSWTEEEAFTFASSFDETTRKQITSDVVRSFPKRLDPSSPETSFDDALKIKFWVFGGSARWMFGMETKLAFEDLQRNINKIDDIETLHAGLVGVRGNIAVDHAIAMYRGDDDTFVGDSMDVGNEGSFDLETKLFQFQLISSYVLEYLSKRIGLRAITTMYRTPWVRENPSFHGFIFEWDTLTQIESTKRLVLQDGNGDETTWIVEESVPLAALVRRGISENVSRIMVLPQKWNHPEYDGLYISTDDHGHRHLVAWNASEAVTHSGRVNKLVILLDDLAQRVDTTFASVRFIFIVPTDQMNEFSLPGGSEALLASQQLFSWSFAGFEVLGATPST